MASVARIAAVDPRFEAEEGVFPAQRSPWMTDIRKSEGRAKQRMKQRKGRYSSLLEKCQGELKETKALLKHNERPLWNVFKAYCPESKEFGQKKAMQVHYMGMSFLDRMGLWKITGMM